MHRSAFTLLAASLFATSAFAAETPGQTAKSAIEVCEPIGQQAYLKQLVCPNGKAPLFERKGNVGFRNEPANPQVVMATIGDRDALMRNNIPAGTPDFHMVDEYDVTCAGTPPQKLYLDMYHCGALTPLTPPAGFSVDVDPDILVIRNNHTDTKPSADNQKLISRLLECEFGMLYGSKLPIVTNAAAMRALYPRLGVTAFMLGATADQYRAQGDAIKTRTTTGDKLTVATAIAREAEVCRSEFTARADELQLYKWRSSKLRKMYPEADAAYLP